MLGEEMGMPAAVFSVCLVLISLLVIQVVEENAITSTHISTADLHYYNNNVPDM